MTELRFPEAIDNTMRKELVKCQKAAHYRFEMGLQPVGEDKVDLVAGRAFAAGMEAVRKGYYAQGMLEKDAIEAGIKAVHETYENFVPPPKSNKTVDRMAGALVYYFSKNPLATEELRPLVLGDKTMVEIAFNYEIPIMHPVTGKSLTYCGRFDMLAQDKSGAVWVVDEKTTSMYGTKTTNDWSKWQNQWPLDSQMTGYCWGAKQLLKEHGLDLEVAGALINGVAIGMSAYDTIRTRTYREDWMIERWFEQMQYDVQRWKVAYEDQVHAMALDHACAFYNNPCQYAKLCVSKNPERLIDGNYIVKFWNPVKRENV